MATDWIQTLQNRKLTQRELKPEQVGTIEEVAHALAGKFRFSCQTQQRYSVAEHCVRGARLLPKAFAGAFLLHELSEVYLPDISAPMKPFVFVEVPDQTEGANRLVEWSKLERQHTRAMLDALGLSSIESLIYSSEVRRMDLAMLAAEKRDLVGPEPEPWGLDVEPATDEKIIAWHPDYAEREFLELFGALFR